MFNDSFFDHHQPRQQGSWCSSAHLPSPQFFQQSSSNSLQPGSFTSPSSFGTTSLARMESTFCKNFVCCSIPLDDLHDLLEHFEQAHCHQSSSPTVSNDSNGNRPDLVVFEDEDEWSGTESVSTNLSSGAGFERGQSSSSENWSASTNSRDHSNHSRRTNNLNHWLKIEDGFGIPPSLLNGQNKSELNDSNDPNQFLMMIDVDEDGCSSAGSDRNPSNHENSSNPLKRSRYATDDRDWDSGREKPFKCSVPGCEKAYKQPNGLKYHKAHGHCVQKFLSAEEESKIFVCHDSVCGKRYKNINGLRYHYQHTGPHGTIGLQLLSMGLHPFSSNLNLPSLDSNHQHLHPLLISRSNYVSSSQDEGSVSGLTSSDMGDATMDEA